MGDVGQRCLSVVMPCYNERETIREIVGQVLESPLVAELVIVDDDSIDGTRDLLRELTDERVRIVEQPINLGKGAALRRGFQEVTSPGSSSNAPRVARPVADSDMSRSLGMWCPAS
jgi:glycosyltransferase involved in cell wall biosynthesis